ncbi:MAG: bifunctional (p)ppGpp synthetase/guanosine-3',5'-bis(diphosphate) 3'-pyrophosphohydrolase [Gemmatimonadetes bacterium]|nr:bifunctional (p)ppGpp synthetase/guanosine-3',5'-bis(diphosphate) 3'-pyrophosphohydrolase [Gemmatimonadota bacterium]
MTTVLADLDATLAEALGEQAGRLDLELIDRAYRLSAAAHRGQKRVSGEDFISHTVAVARILLDHRMDSVTIAAALLHDTVEDSDVSIEDIREQFGDEIGDIVDGLTKISSLSFRSTSEEQAENYRKLLVSIAKDARVIIVKLADRLHNMRTLDPLPAERRERIARETRELYAPLAHRFGMAGIRADLEDLAFKFLERDDYKDLNKKLKAKRVEREEMINRMRGPLVDALTDEGLDAEVTGRLKHMWSVYRKMRQRDKPLEEIYDLMAIRVLVRTVPECYHVLGVIHNHWTPLQERIKDYIASPKSNGYQSLHTTVFGPGGEPYEIQIRTYDMHRTAEFGIAAHWVYKEGQQPDELDLRLSWFRQLMELQQTAHSAEEFLEFLKIDLYEDEIFVFTPKGDVKRLPKGATTIDFAFAVHTEVGLRCQGAKVNQRIAPLHRPLDNGDTVTIITGPNARPSRDWLNHVRTGRARQGIRHWIKQEEAERSIAIGRDILARELRRRRLPRPEAAVMEQAAEKLSVGSEAGLLQALGRGDVPTGQVIRALFPDRPGDDLEETKPTAFGRVMDRIRLGRGVRIQGVDGLLVRYAQCCQPVPGDQVVGYVSQGRGISIHRNDCPNLLTIPAGPDRRVEIDWQEVEGEVFEVCLGVAGEDRRGLYADLMQAVTAKGTNIRSAELRSKDGGMFGTVLVEVENSAQLSKVMRAMRRTKGVTSVERREPPAQAEPS